MNNLYNELTTSTSTTNENGEIITHPPTSLALRAARELKQLSEQLNMAQQHSNACCYQASELSQQLTITQNQLKDTYAELQSLRESTERISDVGSTGGDVPGSGSSSTGSSSSDSSSSVN